MKFPVYLTDKQVKSLEFEVVSTDLRVHLTRLLHRALTSDRDGDYYRNLIIIQQNEVINKALNIRGKPLYQLEGDGDGQFHPAEYAWHDGEFQLLFRRLNAAELVELLCDLVRENYFTVEQLNTLLKKDGSSIRFSPDVRTLGVEVLSIRELEDALAELDKDAPTVDHHPNIRILLSRAEDALTKEDSSAVVHSCASVFETLAKDILGDPKFDNQPLGRFFDKYRQNSSLPEPVLNYILEQYGLRNTAPLAGHGSRLTPPSLKRDQMVMLIEITKAFVKTEYRSATIKDL